LFVVSDFVFLRLLAAENMKTARTEKLSHADYFKIGVSVDCVIFGYENGKLKVLLIQSDLEEYRDKWSLLGDLVRPDEDLDEASYRVLKDRTGLDDLYLWQVHAFGKINRHPSGRVVTVAYYTLININDHKLKIQDNAIHWHSVNEIDDLAFDHQRILEDCLLILREHVFERPVVFNLLGDKFSLRELQELYEAILGLKLDRRNFRKKIGLKGWIQDLNEFESDVSHRPGKLYRAVVNEDTP